MPSETSTVPKSARQQKSNIKKIVMGLVLATGTIYLIFAVNPIIRVFKAPSASMAPGLPIDSSFVVNRASYGYSAQTFDWFPLPIKKRWPLIKPKRGDIAVFRAHIGGKLVLYVKRIVGLPGERIKMNAGRLLINGVTVGRLPMRASQLPDHLGKMRPVQTWMERLPNGVAYPVLEMEGDKGFLDNTPEFTIPAGHYFLLGDNRDNSTDSRLPRNRNGIGMIPLEDFVGKVVWVSGGK